MGSGEESQLIRTGHGLGDHDYDVVKYSSPGTAIEEQMLAFEVGFDMERVMESEFAVLDGMAGIEKTLAQRELWPLRSWSTS